jgi:hypothetical protein
MLGTLYIESLITVNMKVMNLESPRSGKPVANQFVIRAPEGEYFQSYQSIVAFKPRTLDDRIVFGKDWDYSNTTRKYLHQFMLSHGINMTTEEKRKAVASGEIKVIDL